MKQKTFSDSKRRKKSIIMSQMDKGEENMDTKTSINDHCKPKIKEIPLRRDFTRKTFCLPFQRLSPLVLVDSA